MSPSKKENPQPPESSLDQSNEWDTSWGPKLAGTCCEGKKSSGIRARKSLKIGREIEYSCLCRKLRKIHLVPCNFSVSLSLSHIGHWLAMLKRGIPGDICCEAFIKFIPKISSACGLVCSSPIGSIWFSEICSKGGEAHLASSLQPTHKGGFKPTSQGPLGIAALLQSKEAVELLLEWWPDRRL